MKKSLFFGFILLTAILLSSCQNNQNAIENALNQHIEKIISDINKGNFEKTLQLPPQSTFNNRVVDNLVVDVRSIKVNNSDAELKLTITQSDFSELYRTYWLEMDKRSEGYQVTEESPQSLLNNLTNSSVFSSRKFTLSLHATKTNKSWTIRPDNALYNALLGGIPETAIKLVTEKKMLATVKPIDPEVAHKLLLINDFLANKLWGAGVMSVFNQFSNNTETIKLAPAMNKLTKYEDELDKYTTYLKQLDSNTYPHFQYVWQQINVEWKQLKIEMKKEMVRHNNGEKFNPDIMKFKRYIDEFEYLIDTNKLHDGHDHLTD
jgi:PBP1b-binding outer membrane lipoprotein LpoB